MGAQIGVVTGNPVFRQTAGLMHNAIHFFLPRSVRIAVISLVVSILAAGGGWAVLAWLRPALAPAYKTEFLIDTTAGTAADGPETITNSLKTVVENSGDHDALALRSFGGQCGAQDNTTQLVGFGTDNRQDITQAASAVREGSKFPASDEFRWELATLAFPVEGGAKSAGVPLAGNGTVVALKPGSLNIAGSIRSTNVTLNFRYGGTYRTDIGFYDEGQPIGFTEASKDSFRIYLDISFSGPGGPPLGGINVLGENFRLTLPNHRIVQPDWNPNVLLDKDNWVFSKEAICTQVDTPAAGTYTLTYTEHPYAASPDPVSITFTIAE